MATQMRKTPHAVWKSTMQTHAAANSADESFSWRYGTRRGEIAFFVCRAVDELIDTETEAGGSEVEGRLRIGQSARWSCRALSLSDKLEIAEDPHQQQSIASVMAKNVVRVLYCHFAMNKLEKNTLLQGLVGVAAHSAATLNSAAECASSSYFPAIPMYSLIQYSTISSSLPLHDARRRPRPISRDRALASLFRPIGCRRHPLPRHHTPPSCTLAHDPVAARAAMDWSAVYENSGEEAGNWEDHGETRSSRNAHRLLHRRASLPPAKQRAGYSPLVAYAFTVNYILGVGSLGIPFAFHRAGLLMGNAMIALVTLLSYVTVMWVCESVARAREAFAQSFLPLDESAALKRFSFSYSSAASTPVTSRRVSGGSAALEFDDFPEVTQLCDRFLGPVGSKMYQVSLLGLMYGGLVGYSQVFVNTFLTQVDHVGDWQLSSVHAAAVFACIVVPLSCSDLTEQIYVQLTMSVVRFAALLIMIVSAAYAVYGDPYDSGAEQEPAPEAAPYVSHVSLLDLSGFGVMFSTGVFSQLFQHSVPGLLAPLGAKNQEKAPAIFGCTLLTTMVFYIALGSICSLYFGPKLATSVNLNWADFTWGINESMTLVPLWAKLLSMIVVVFPALDTLSVFPLISVTLGDNMAAVIPKRWTRGGRKATWKLVCRFGASLPPLLISMFVSDLSVTLQISGLMGIYVAFFAPALLQLQASREFPTSNIYSGKFSGVGYVYGVLIFGTMALIVLLYQLVLQVAG
ncbi:unnamed protein product [Phytophthora fragariaefolia]|uniref:Unnamed protein product n=1 Tax=Phytophthora fragariaefolia TaxID=1490495 RepID=A0A9W7CSK1_9STRA|nr:unnamed protein product [Phytophthora fragariaefolia]